MTRRTGSADPIARAVGEALTGRRYEFSIHGRPTAGRNRRSPRRGPYAVTTPHEFSLARFAHSENLMAACRILRATGGHGPGADGLTFEDFSDGEMFRALRSASRAILAGSYLPYSTLVVLVPKGDGRHRELRLQRIVDRTISKALQIVLGPYWDVALPHLRRDPWTLLAEFGHAIREYQWYHLATDDIRDCYPSLRMEDVLRCHREHLGESATSFNGEPTLMGFVETVLRGHEGPSRELGLDQGSPCVPAAAELTLRSILDLPLDARGPGHPLFLRYVDNLNVLGSSAHHCGWTLSVIRHLLTPYGLTLKSQDGDPVDVRDPGHGRKVLGLIPLWRDDHLGLLLPESAYGRLREGLGQAWDHPDPVLVARRVVEGWLQATAPTAATYEDGQNVVARAMDVAAGRGFRGMSRDRLLRVTRDACRRWMTVREGVSRGPGRPPGDGDVRGGGL